MWYKFLGFFFFFFFRLCFLCNIQKKIIAKTDFKSYFPVCFLLGILWFLGLTFDSLIHFKIIFFGGPVGRPLLWAQQVERAVLRYASLYFCCAIEDQDNELITLEIIHHYVELLDKYFDGVCELDIIFNFEKDYFILDEFLLGEEVQETSKKNVLKATEQADLLQEEVETPRSNFLGIPDL
uniref:AP complex mu/sigma subunit domain-containing protein n=1 Tax=Sus scrofa TaxID=9823 RepID=A0A8D0VNY7_PIG